MAPVQELQLRGGRPYLIQAGAPLHLFLDGLKRVVFVEDRRDLHHLNTGDLVVVLGGSAGRTTATIEKLAIRMEREGVAGLLVHARSIKDPEGELRAPDSMPVIVVPEDIEWAEVLQPLLRLDASLKTRTGNPELLRAGLLEGVIAQNGRIDIAAVSAREVGIDLTEPHRCYVVCTSCRMPEEFLARLEEVVATELLDHDSLGTVLRRPTGIIALDATEGFGVAEALLEKALRIPKVQTIAIGVGRPHRGARGIFRSYREARWASVVGHRLLGHNRVTRFEELGPYAWLEPLDFDHDSDACTAIETLIEHDGTNHTKLLETLQVFLESKAFKEAAELLYVHRNTLRYRLESIRKLTGLDVLEPESRLVLEVQLRLAMVRGLVPQHHLSAS